MRFLRLNYILPRLLLLLLVLAAAEVGSGYFIRWALIQGGEAALGARVEIGDVKASLLRTRLQMANITVANPRAAMRNLLQADRVDIDFDSAALSRKKLYAPYGEITGLKFDTDRTTSGLLANAPSDEEKAASAPWLTDEAKVYADNWLDGIEDRFEQDLRRELHSIGLAEELAAKWPAEYQSLRTSAKQLKVNAESLTARVKEAKQNPLRHAEFLANLPNELAALRRQLHELQARIEQLPGMMQADRQRLAAARAHDEQVIRQKLKVDAIDADTLTHYLLGEQLAGPVRDAIDWVTWVRGMLPEKRKTMMELDDHTQRGVDILFAGSQQYPDLWLQKIRLTGSAQLNAQPLQLAGHIYDVTTHPELVKKPTVLEFNTTQGLPVKVVARLNRAGAVPHDQLLIDCDALPLAAIEMGKRGPLGLSAPASVAQLSISMTMTGDQLDGEVQLVQRGVQLTPVVRNPKFGDELSASLTQSLSQLDQIATRVTLSGTLTKPRVELWSNLGPAVAESTQQAVTGMLTRRANEAYAEVQAKVNTEVQRVEGQLLAFQQEITGELAQPGETIAKLLGQRGPSVMEQLGKLPTGSLFK